MKNSPDFVSTVEYKAKWYGRQFHKVSKFAATTKNCFVCGTKNEKITLSHRVFNCPICGHTEDRDLHAAKNVLKMSRAELARI